MRNNTEYISRYLQNDITEEEKIAFENELAVNKELQQEFFIQQQIMKAAETGGVKKEFSKAIRKKIIIKQLLQWGIVSVVLIGAFVFYAIKTDLFSKHKEKPSVEVVEKFVINNTADTIIETRDGVVFAIPANAFNSDLSTIRLEIRTALNANDIMQQGLSTMSNGSLLETGGMFYINGYDENGQVSLAKNINVSVPAATIDPAMQLFKGVRDSNGNVNWVNPTPVENKLQTYDITTLDFYPQDYIPTVKALGKDHTDKPYTDSLYYSFSGYPYASINERDGAAIFYAKCASCHTMGRDAIGPNLQGVVGRWGGNREHIKLWIKNYAKALNAGIPRAKEVISFSTTSMQMFEGTITERELDALITYIDEWKSSATPATVTNTKSQNEISSADPIPAKDTTGRPVLDSVMRDSTIKIQTDAFKKQDTLNNYNHFELDPSRIRAIWNKKFNNTILATKEFEERLKYIHTLCDPKYLDAYVQGLDKPMHEIDKLCADRSSGAVREKFLEFAARKNGVVRIEDGMQEKLSNYFQNKFKAYQQAVEKTMAKHETELNKLAQIANDKQREQQTKEFIREDENFQEELCANLTDAYRQIGVKRSCDPVNDTIVPTPPTTYYNISIDTTGWYNLDKFVFDATITRQTMNYTDPETGKTATLTYKDVSISIGNLAAYDKVFVYLVPNGLNSFQRVEQQENVFKESLNSLFKYDAIAIGFKDTERYFYRQSNLQEGEYSFNLSKANDDELKEMMKNYSTQKSKDLDTEFEYRLFEQQEAARQVQLRKDLEFREQIANAIFKCGQQNPVINPARPK